MGSIARLYLAGQERFAATVAGLAPEQWATPVVACPGWTVHDVLAHVSGVADDVVNGRVEGAGTDPWTEAQVARSRSTPSSELLSRWAGQAAQVAEVLEAVDQPRAVIDCITHVFDVLAPLGRSADRHDTLVQAVTPWLFGASGEGGSVRVITEAGDYAFGASDIGGDLELRISTFEAFRSRLGRRSRRQVENYSWSAPPGPVLEDWFVFGPAGADVVE